jgi:hypothetical protein
MPNLIDKLFRKKLQERNFHPEAGDWAAMNKLIDQSMGTGGLAKGSGGTGFSLNWLAILLVSAGTAFGVYYAIEYSQKDKTTSEKVTLTSSKKINSGISTENNGAKAALTTAPESSGSKNNNERSQHDPITEIPGSDNNILRQSKHEENSLRPIEASRFETNSIEKNITDNSELIAPGSGSSAAIATSANKITPIEQKTVTKQSSSTQDIDETSDNAIAYSNKPNINGNPTQYKNSSTKAKDKPIASNKNQGSNAYGFNDYSKSDFDAPMTGLESLSIPSELYLSSSPITSFKSKKLQNIKPLVSKDDSDVFKVQNKKPRRSLPLQLSLAAFGELSYITKNITGDSEYAALIRLRNDEEKNIITAGGGLEFQVKYKQFGLSSGFAISNWGENVQYEEQYSIDWDVTITDQTDTLFTEEVIYTIDTIFNPNDSTWYVFIDSSFVTVVDTIITTTNYDSTEVETPLGLSAENGKTTISYWEIPLYFSYQFDLGDFYLSPGIGVNIGFLKVTRGYYMNESIDGLISINTAYAVMRKTLLSGQINLGVGYRLGSKFAVEATPIYRFNLGNAFEKGGIVQKYSSLSLQFKLRYYF